MKKFTALALVAGLGTAASAEYTLTYDPATGEVVLDTQGGTINGYGLEAGAGEFLFENHASFLGGTKGSIDTGTASIVSETNPFQPVSGVFNIGAVLPTGLSEWPALTENSYTTALGAPILAFDLVVIPEPTSIALLGLGGLLVARRRRSA